MPDLCAIIQSSFGGLFFPKCGLPHIFSSSSYFAFNALSGQKNRKNRIDVVSKKSDRKNKKIRNSELF